MMKKAILAASLFSIAIAAGTALTAQEINPGERLERLRTFMEQRRQTRPRLAPPPVGRLAAREEQPAVNWDEAQRLIAASRNRASSTLSAATTAVRTPTGATEGVIAASPANLPRIRAAEIEATRIPVLIPATARIGQTVQVIGQPDAYTAIAEIDDGIDLRMSGSRKRLRLERPSRARQATLKLRSARPPLPGVDARYVISRSESSTDLSFSRFNIGYVLSIICDVPDDARCAEDDFIIKLASSMALLNERPGGAQ